MDRFTTIPGRSPFSLSGTQTSAKKYGDGEPSSCYAKLLNMFVHTHRCI